MNNNTNADSNFFILTWLNMYDITNIALPHVRVELSNYDRIHISLQANVTIKIYILHITQLYIVNIFFLKDGDGIQKIQVDDAS